ncbi:acyl-CoA dehydrogenase family protein [Kiloniella antarctica]|uniref:Acyl-CoA dehydrogenase family protein n=1 Tax=Kiloniella antarctica TaxID=1550907 RepID=A0ABW5BL43_9PROT
MNFTFSEEQNLFRDSIRRYLEETYPFENRAKTLQHPNGYSEELWQSLAELGWLALPFAEEYDGLGGSAIDSMIVMEEIGRALLVSPILSTVLLSGQLIANAGTESQKYDLIPQIGAGKLKLALAFAEPDAGYDLAQVATSATKEGNGYRLNGAKCVVFNAQSADIIIVVARTSGHANAQEGLSLFLLDPTMDGLNLKNYRTHDGGCASDIILDDLFLPDKALLGDIGMAYPHLQRVVDQAAVALCAEASGAMWAICEQSGAYFKTREQFGQNLGSFQALQHRLVDVYMKCQLSQSLVYDAVCALDDQDLPKGQNDFLKNADGVTKTCANKTLAQKVSQKVSAAKYHVGMDARSVGQEGIQFHGGMGMMTELPIGHYYKRITMINATFGDPRYHLKRYRDLMYQPINSAA